MKQKKFLVLFLILIFFSLALTAQQQETERAKQTPQHFQPNEQKFFPYRGSRMGNSPAAFFVIEIETELDDDKIELEIKFNTQIDPNSFNHKSILINGRTLPDRTRIKFNKAGTKIELVIPAQTFYKIFSNPFSIELLNAKSFNELSLEKKLFKEIYIDAEYRFPPPFLKNKNAPAFPKNEEPNQNHPQGQ